MSTSDLYLLFGKSVRHWSEHRNGWGSAPLIWDWLSDKYIDEKPIYSLDEKHLKKVCKLSKADGLSNAELAALYFTFDNAYIPKELLEQVAEWFDQVYQEISTQSRWNSHANHWGDFATELRKVLVTVTDHHLRGVCISCTSVDDIWFYDKGERAAAAWSICEEPNP